MASGTEGGTLGSQSRKELDLMYNSMKVLCEDIQGLGWQHIRWELVLAKK